SISIKPMSEDDVVYIYTTTGTNSLGCSASAEFTLIAVVCTGVDELKMEHERLKIYPNPATEIINVESPLSPKGGTVTIYDVLGSIVLEQAITPPLEGKWEAAINVSELKRGIYFI